MAEFETFVTGAGVGFGRGWVWNWDWGWGWAWNWSVGCRWWAKCLGDTIQLMGMVVVAEEVFDT